MVVNRLQCLCYSVYVTVSMLQCLCYSVCGWITVSVRGVARWDPAHVTPRVKLCMHT